MAAKNLTREQAFAEMAKGRRCRPSHWKVGAWLKKHGGHLIDASGREWRDEHFMAPTGWRLLKDLPPRAELVRELAELKSEFEAMREDRDMFQRDLVNCRSELARKCDVSVDSLTLREQLEAAQAKLLVSRSKVGGLEAQLADVTKKWESCEASSASQMKVYDSEVRNWAQRNNELARELAEVRDNHRADLTRLDTWKSRALGAEAKCVTMCEQVKALAQSTADLATTKAALEAEQKQHGLAIDAWKGMLEQAESDLQRARTELEGSEALRMELAEALAWQVPRLPLVLQLAYDNPGTVVWSESRNCGYVMGTDAKPKQGNQYGSGVAMFHEVRFHDFLATDWKLQPAPTAKPEPAWVDCSPEKAREMHALGKRVRHNTWFPFETSPTWLHGGALSNYGLRREKLSYDAARDYELSCIKHLSTATATDATGWQWQEVGQ